MATDEDMSVNDVLEAVCSKRQFVPNDCFIRVRLSENEEYIIPSLTDNFECLVSLELSSYFLFYSAVLLEALYNFCTVAYKNVL